MITTITLNTMLDKTVYIDVLKKGTIHRARQMEMVAGGKGVNVSRQLTALGCDTVATGFLGGETGEIITRLLRQENIKNDFVYIDSVTREGVTYREADGTVTAVFEPPHTISPADAKLLIDKVKISSGASDWVVCGGSSPSPVSDHVYKEVLQHTRTHKLKSVLDTYGESLRLAIDERPYILKANLHEFGSTFGYSLSNDAACRKALDICIEKGIWCTILTNGGEPVYVGTGDGHWLLRPPAIDLVNPTGSGDAMTAGFIFGCEQGWDFERSLVFATAAGAANAQKWAVANSTYDEIEKLVDRVILTKL
jgi:tagatose 6-phosphate kinase